MYDHNRIADPSFGIKSQEQAVLAYLSNQEPHFAEYKDGAYQISFSTYPWYNGRERGICLQMSPEWAGGDNYLNIAIFEHRNSDQLICLKWKSERAFWNYPLEDPKTIDKAYHGGNKWTADGTFSYLDIKGVVNWVMNECEIFYKKHHKYEKKESK